MQNQNDTDKLKVLPPVRQASEFSQSQRTDTLSGGGTRAPHLSRMTFIVEKNITSYPVNIGFFSPN